MATLSGFVRWCKALRGLSGQRSAIERQAVEMGALSARLDALQMRDDAQQQALHALGTRSDELVHTLQRRQQELRDLAVALDAARERIELESEQGRQVRDGVRLEITSLATGLGAAAHANMELAQAARDLDGKHESLLRRLAEIAPAFPAVGELAADDSAAWFHAAVEGAFRGSVDEIRARLRVYVPYLSGIPSGHQDHRALDLGCGRGEWLTLMRDHGHPAVGVDANPVSVGRCIATGLQVVRGDAIEYLRGQPNDSVSLVTAFHLVEHLPVESLVAMLVEARRVLVPGGLLLVETPNADNLLVGASSFYLDPTHRRPLPAPLLRVIVEFTKFEVVETLSLQPDETLRAIAEREGWPATLIRFLAGPRDTGIIARKAADADRAPVAST